MAGDLNRSIKIFLDNSSAMASADQLKQRIGELEKKLYDLQSAGQGNSDQSKKIQKELDAQSRKYEKYRQEVMSTERVLKNLSGATYKELLDVKRKLSNELQTTTRGTTEYTAKLNMLKGVSKEIALVQRDMRTEVGCQATTWGRAADFVNKYMGIIGSGVAALTGITMAFSRFREERNKLEESRADLKALTGLDDESISWLSKEASRLSTSVTKDGIRIRESAKEILEAYKLVGSAKPELLTNKEALAAVTEQTLILASASGMKLTDAVEAVTLAMNQYGAEANEASRYVNVLAAGSKYGAVAVESQTESSRKSGVSAASANISLEELVGTIETLGEKGIKDEIAGTGLKKFFLTLQTGSDDTNPKVVGLTTALENLRKKQMDAAEVKKMFGEEGYNVASVLINESEQVAYYTQAVTGTSIALEQASIKSETAAAKYAQVKNRLTEMGVELLETMNPAILGAANATVNWTGKLVHLAGWIKENSTEIVSVAAGLATYSIAVNSSVIADKLKVLWTERVVVSMKSMYATMLKHPYGLMAAVVLTWLLYMRKANQELSQMERVQRKLTEVDRTASQAIVEQKTTLEQLLRVARDENESKSRRLSAVEKLNALSPEYLGNLTLEEIHTDKATSAVNRYVTSIYDMAKAQAAKEQLVEIEREKLRLESDPEAFQEMIPWWEEMEIGFLGLMNTDRADRALNEMVARGRARMTKAKAALEAQAAALRSVIEGNVVVDPDDDLNPNKKPTPKGKITKESVDLKLKEMETTHAAELSLLKKQRLEIDQEDTEYMQKVLESDRMYYQKRIEVVANYLKAIKDPKLKADLEKQLVDLQTSLLDIEQKSEANRLSMVQQIGRAHV